MQFYYQHPVLQCGADGGKASHGAGQANVPADGPDLQHQVFALLEKADLGFGREWGLDPDLVMAIPLPE